MSGSYSMRQDMVPSYQFPIQKLNPDSLTPFGLFDRDSQQTIMEEGNEGINIVNLRVMLSNEHVASERFPPAARSAVCIAPARESKVK
eukprot:1134925-Prymnesium_polylepis.2